MNLFRILSLMKKDDEYRTREKFLTKLAGREYLSEEEVNELFSYKHLEYHANPDARKITQKAFASSDLGEKFRLLRRLNGVGVIMTSTILMFQNPNRYAELNPVCWNSLIRNFGFKASEKDGRSDYGIPEYTTYLEAIKSIADEYGMKIGEVEYVLSHSE